MAAAAPLSVAIVGGSIAGLATATALLRLGIRVRVFELSPTPLSGKGGSLGFVDVPLWEQLKGARMMRRGTFASRQQGAFLYGDLWDFWYKSLPPGVVTLGKRVESLGDDAGRPMIDGETFDVAVVADGGWSELRARHFGASRAWTPTYAGYQVWRFKVDARKVPHFRGYGDAMAGITYTILLPVPGDDGTDWIMGGTAVAAPEADIVAPSLEARANRHVGADERGDVRAPAAPRAVRAAAGVAAAGPDGHTDAAAALDTLPVAATAAGDGGVAAFLAMYRSAFGRHGGGDLVRAMDAAAAHGRITAMPLFEFAAPRVTSGRRVLIGDAAHMASPRTAVGAHTAVLDAAALYDAFRVALGGGGGGAAPAGGWGPVVDRALALYAGPARQRAQQLYERSVEVGADVVPRGWRRSYVHGGRDHESA